MPWLHSTMTAVQDRLKYIEAIYCCNNGSFEAAVSAVRKHASVQLLFATIKGDYTLHRARIPL